MKQRWRNATLVTPQGEAARDLLVESGRFAAIVERDSRTSEDWQDVDVSGKILFPGVIDLLQHGLDVNLYNDTADGAVAHSSQLLPALHLLPAAWHTGKHAGTAFCADRRGGWRSCVGGA